MHPAAAPATSPIIEMPMYVRMSIDLDGPPIVNGAGDMGSKRFSPAHQFASASFMRLPPRYNLSRRTFAQEVLNALFRQFLDGVCRSYLFRRRSLRPPKKDHCGSRLAQVHHP